MKASVFIQTALIDQMQQIADLGLWFHLAKLIPSGVDMLTRVTERNENGGRTWGEHNPMGLALTDPVPVWEFYKKFFPPGYHERSVYSSGSNFFAVSPNGRWLTSAPEDAGKHLQPIGEKEEWRVQSCYVHVPQWFEDFKTACRQVLAKIESGELQDIEVLAQKEV